MSVEKGGLYITLKMKLKLVSQDKTTQNTMKLLIHSDVDTDKPRGVFHLSDTRNTPAILIHTCAWHKNHVHLYERA